MYRVFRRSSSSVLIAIICGLWLVISSGLTQLDNSVGDSNDRQLCISVSEPSVFHYSDTSAGESFLRHSQVQLNATFRAIGMLSAVSEIQLGEIAIPRLLSLRDGLQPSLFGLGIALRL